jgi:hypothetical protein
MHLNVVNLNFNSATDHVSLLLDGVKFFVATSELAKRIPLNDFRVQSAYHILLVLYHGCSFIKLAGELLHDLVPLISRCTLSLLNQIIYLIDLLEGLIHFIHSAWHLVLQNSHKFIFVKGMISIHLLTRLINLAKGVMSLNGTLAKLVRSSLKHVEVMAFDASADCAHVVLNLAQRAVQLSDLNFSLLNFNNLFLLVEDVRALRVSPLFLRVG